MSKKISTAIGRAGKMPPTLAKTDKVKVGIGMEQKDRTQIGRASCRERVCQYV